ncbi:protein NnrT [Sulfitobacter sp. M57]|uniref:protein NnrT n=1 Tax=unclassified Sulfitobacter TaxID=196795 RepID=UPI0023E278C7|nr:MULTISPECIES: protein NnrT [unclassified Sulfitobacter]MDF3416627.1 protein NnrT [Sulfitobacter sp. KE5]MDF3424107.1 protein NnrT [Sulfitobacter sp. KE43]MDF3435172.1 protein NnrT [Sulfitobacter sp. KE42]MDF3460824.1 protein NnrT [Sulfitobacter sp. S74]MDF3464709.1 protein NnrT [Sulfitobacter sp. Ks18]
MRISTSFMAIIMTTPAFAEAYDRPIPQAQSATAEFWYALACLALVGAMIAVQRLVSRR